MGGFAFGFAGCSLSGKAHLCQLTKAFHVTFPITCAAIVEHPTFASWLQSTPNV